MLLTGQYNNVMLLLVLALYWSLGLQVKPDWWSAAAQQSNAGLSIDRAPVSVLAAIFKPE